MCKTRLSDIQPTQVKTQIRNEQLENLRLIKLLTYSNKLLKFENFWLV